MASEAKSHVVSVVDRMYFSKIAQPSLVRYFAEIYELNLTDYLRFIRII